MNKFVAVIACALLAASVTAHAGAGCCAAGKAKSEAKTTATTKLDGCYAMLSRLDLTPDQKAKVDALHAECQKEKCTDTSQAKFVKGLEQILTPAQVAQCKELCAKEGKGACLMAQAANK